MFHAEAPPPFVVSALFRVGRGDELATTSGKTHLVEHLALPARSRRRLEFNGTVDNILTSFWASGTEEEARAFLASIARTLAALPVERLETERQILLAEEATQGPNLTRLAFALRYGPVGHGLLGYDEYGLRRLTSTDVLDWSSQRFTRRNAAIWLTGPEPGELELELPDGERHLPPTAATIPEVRDALSCIYRAGPAGAVAFSVEANRTLAFRVGLNVLAHRIQDRLRYELGLAYDAEMVFVPLTADRVHVVIVSDSTDQNVPRVAAEALRTIDELADGGPTDEELEDELFHARRYSASREELPSQLFYAAAQSLMGAEHQTAASLLAEQERLTSEDVAGSIAAARRTLLVIVPDVPVELAGVAEYPVYSPLRVEGRRFRPPGLRLRSGSAPELVVGADGASFTFGAFRAAARFDECAAALRYPDGSWTLLSRDGYFVVVDPSAWRKGAEAAAAVAAGVPEELVVRMEPALSERTDAVEDVAAEKLDRRWVVSEELQLLPDRLEQGERVVTLCEAMKGLRAGLLVATDRRVIFFAKIRRETWLELGYDEIESVSGKTGLTDSSVTIRVRGEELSFTGIAPKERTMEMVAEIEARLSDPDASLTR